VLDAFAGSGALGIEALSRGAAHATFVEREFSASRVLSANVERLGLKPRSTVIAADVRALARKGALPGAPFALLFADPPYRIDEAEVRGLVESLADAGCLEPGALIVWEHDARTITVWPECVEAVGEKRYGSTAVSVAEYVRGATA
jgi:16S rRNA (guanine966-N2)-methyltransferase